MTYRPPPIPGQEFNEKCSWFGNYGRFYDREDNGENASGMPQSVLGIAFYCKATLRHWWRVTLPNGYSASVQQVDLGPGPETGRGIDINAALATHAGYSPSTFPTDTTITFVYLGATP